jgi:LysM repeat protein
MQECKRELAKSVIQPISMDRLQREVDWLRATNQALQQQLRDLRSTTANRGPASANGSSSAGKTAARTAPAPSPTQAELSPGPALVAQANSSSRGPAPNPAARVHKVAAGETPMMIARHYNVKLSALQSANPSMDPKRLRPGQTLNIPAP